MLGLAAGAETPASAHVLSRLVPERLRARLFSIRQTGNQIGAIAASLALPAIAESFGWAAGLLLLALSCTLGALLLASKRHLFRITDAPTAQDRRPSVRDCVRLA